MPSGASPKKRPRKNAVPELLIERRTSVFQTTGIREKGGGASGAERGTGKIHYVVLFVQSLLEGPRVFQRQKPVKENEPHGKGTA